MRTDPNKGRPVTKLVVERIILSGQMTRRDHLQLTSVLLSDQRVSHDDRLQINRVLEDVQIGKLELVD